MLRRFRCVQIFLKQHRQQWHCGFLPPTPHRVIISATTDNRKFGNYFPLAFSHFLKYGGTQKMRRDSSHTRISHTKIAKNVICPPLRQSHIWKTNAAVAQLGEASKIKPNWHPVTTGLSRPSKLRMSLELSALQRTQTGTHQTWVVVGQPETEGRRCKGSLGSPGCVAPCDSPMTCSRYRAAGISPMIPEYTPDPQNSPITRGTDPAVK